MFSDDDPGLAEVRRIALAYPDAIEKVSHGRPGFFVSKMFAMYGGSVKPETKGGDYLQYARSIVVKVDENDRRALQADNRFFYPAYLGPACWLGLDFSATKKVDWHEVRELIDASFRMVAPKTAVRRLDDA